MPPTPNPEPKFDHEMAELYQRVAKNHYHEAGPWKLMLRTIQDSNIVKSSSSFQVLDLASGHGEPSLMIAQTFPSQAKVISTDYSEEMVALAQERSRGVPNMTVQQADMQSLPFGSEEFDIITCSYGFMFPPDKSKAIRETYRCLKPGGMLLATTWDRLPMMELVSGIMTKVLGETPPPPPLNPMSLSEPNLFEKMLMDEGFVNVESRRSTYPFLMEDDEFNFKRSVMLVKDKLQELDAWEKAREAHNELIPQFVTVDDDGRDVMDGSTFKYTVCYKAEN
jgi:Methylase involved in ubiquinone/menaquinone biosynthesis